jgi:hypothetical protein
MAECNNIADNNIADITDNSLAMIGCELLCYMKCKFGKLSNVKLMSIINDFYSSDDITRAKEIIVDSVDNLGIDKWPKPAKRKNNENKSKTEVNDIFNVFAFVDENLLMDKLPKFVAINVDNLPSARLEEGDLRCVLNKLDLLDTKLDTFSASITPSSTSLQPDDLKSVMGKLTNIESQIVSRASEAVRPTFPRQVSATSRQPVQAGVKPPVRTWAELVEPASGYRNGERASVTTGIDTDGNDSDMGYQLVSHGKRRRHSPTSNSPLVNPATIANPTKSKSKPKTLIGSNSQCTIKAARELRKNKIFYVCNVAKETDSEALKNWLTSCCIKVNNVFVAKTKFEDSNAFRVNIDADHADKFIAECGPHLIIREWVFKAQPKPLVA